MEPVGALPAKQIWLAKYFGKASPLAQISCGCGTRALAPRHGVASAPSAGILVAWKAWEGGRSFPPPHPERLLVEIPTPGDGEGSVTGDLP